MMFAPVLSVECEGLRRTLDIDDVTWVVCEQTHRAALGPCRALLFHGPGVVRRVVEFPDNWDLLPEPELRALSESR